MAFQVKEPSKLPTGAYRDILYGFEGTLALSPDVTSREPENSLAPFHIDSTIEEIEEKLRELHNSETSPEKTTSQTIETLLQNRRARLQKMITYIDVEASLHSLTREFIGDLTNDYSYHIDAVFYSMPNPDRYVPDYKLINPNFIDARDALDVVIEDFDTARVSTDIEVKIHHKSGAYTALHKATDFFEAGFSKWKTFQLHPEKGEVDTLGLDNYLDVAYKRLQKQVNAIRSIRSHLRTRASNLPPDNELLNEYESLLRTQVLATLLKIPEPSMPGDEASKDAINRSKIYKYIKFKPTIIRNLRDAKIALNLTLDRFELTKPPLKVMRNNLNEHIKPCIIALETILMTLE